MGDAREARIELVERHRPPLGDGNYRVTVTQALASSNVARPLGPPGGTVLFKQVRTFSIQGERYVLSPQEVLGVFPPDASSGEYSNVLPHVLLSRSTLPWERTSEDGREDRPWLSLVLFDEREAPTPRVITLQQVRASDGDGVDYPSAAVMGAEPDEDDARSVTVIDVPSELLGALLPTGDELALLAHVRQWRDADGQLAGAERAVVIGNRLPRPGATSVVHLVSVERRYKQGSFARDAKPVRLVSLKSWRFQCVAHGATFTERLVRLDRDVLRLPADSMAPVAPGPAADAARAYVDRSHVVLRHALRGGGATGSWYHGPLISGEPPSADLTLPVRTADALLRFDQSMGMLDISYAAAWELGRLMALENKAFSVALYGWKRAHAREIKDARQRLSHLPWNRLSGEPDMPDLLLDWLRALALVKGIPVGYLVPDERMLPSESIRFFCMDRRWIECLLDGAFSLGRVISSDQERERAVYEARGGLSNMTVAASSPAGAASDGEGAITTITGFLLRSELVSGWPDLQVDAYEEARDRDEAEPQGPLEVLRCDRLSANVLLCLFAGDAGTVEIHQRPVALHFGVGEPAGAAGFSKKIRDPQTGEELQNRRVTLRPGDDRVLRLLRATGSDAGPAAALFAALPGAARVPTSALFALEMIEGVEKVRFTKT